MKAVPGSSEYIERVQGDPILGSDFSYHVGRELMRRASRAEPLLRIHIYATMIEVIGLELSLIRFLTTIPCFRYSAL